MCELPGDKMEQATRDEMRCVDVLSKTLRGFDAIFAQRIAMADAQSRKIAEAARMCREAEDDDAEDPMSTQP
jgi:hypothetical protein